MAEPNTTTALTLSAAIGLASLAPGVDGNALIGAFAGATLVVVSSKERRVLTRLAYMLISLVMGYVATTEIVAVTPLKSTGVAGFFAAALVVALTLQLIERMKTVDPLAFFKGDQWYACALRACLDRGLRGNRVACVLLSA